MNKNWWKELVSMWWDGDLIKNYSPRNPNIAHYYKIKHNIVKRIKPKVIAEIGVRAGYSSFSILSAVPDAKMYAIDIDDYIHGGVKDLFTKHAPKVLSKFNVEFITANSQKLDILPFEVDFIHIDGDHSYEGCLHDLNISKNRAEWILIDDYDYIFNVRWAVNDFIKENNFESEYFNDRFRGNVLIHTNFRRNK